MTATLLLTILCTIGLMAAGMSLFAYSRTRGRAYRLRRVQATTHQLKPASQANLTPALQQFAECSQTCLNELHVLNLFGEQDVAIAESFDRPRRLGLWRRVESANYDYAVAQAAGVFRAWISHYESLEVSEREILLQLGIDPAALQALLATDLDAEHQHPDNHRAEVARAREELERAVQGLARFSPAAYR